MKIDLLGIKINSDTKNTILFLIKKFLGEGQKIFIVTPYSEMIVAAQTDTTFRDILNGATFSLPDGIGILWAANHLKFSPPARLSAVVEGGDEEGVGVIAKAWYLISSLLAIIINPRSLRHPIPEKISGSDFVWDLAKLAADRGYSIFLLGGFDDTPELAAKKLQARFPGLKIAGTLSPPARGGDEEGVGVVEKINSSHADFLFVALGPIAQEKWIYENLSNLRIKLAIGLGGTFDYLASKVTVAPQIWRNLGLEWLWRLIIQPWRLWRIFKGIFGLVWYTWKAQ